MLSYCGFFSRVRPPTAPFLPTSLPPLLFLHRPFSYRQNWMIFGYFFLSRIVRFDRYVFFGSPKSLCAHFPNAWKERDRSMTRGLSGCRRRRTQNLSNSEKRGLLSGNPIATPRAMAPKSFEHQVYITMARTGHRTVDLCRGVISCFVSRLDGISRFCAVYSLTGMIFTVRNSLRFRRDCICL